MDPDDPKLAVDLVLSDFCRFLFGNFSDAGEAENRKTFFDISRFSIKIVFFGKIFINIVQ